jgi:hypothetical protein
MVEGIIISMFIRIGLCIHQKKYFSQANAFAGFDGLNLFS